MSTREYILLHVVVLTPRKAHRMAAFHASRLETSRTPFSAAAFLHNPGCCSPFQDLPSFTHNVYRLVNDLRYYRLCNDSLPPGTVKL